MSFASPDVERLQLPDGRLLAWQAYGAPEGVPVLFLHGFPGCRLQAALLDEPARRQGLRLIAPDRPGFGLSSPAPGRSLLSYAGDLHQLAGHLGLHLLGLLGVSCGGAYAMAAASRLGPMVVHLGLMAGMGPMDQPALRKGQLLPLRLLFGLARLRPGLAAPLLALDRLGLQRDAEAAVKALARWLSPADRALLQQRPEILQLFAQSLAEAYRQGIQGAVQEAALIAGPRGFALGEVNVPCDVYQGGQDGHVPPAMGRYLAHHLAAAQLHQYPKQGHLSILFAAFEDYACRCAARAMAAGG